MKSFERLFYDDPYEVLAASISASGKTVKEVACKAYPGCTPDTAKSKLSRALSSENHDVHLSLENILVVLDETIPEHFINYLCDRYGFIRPQKKKELTPEEELKALKERIKENRLEPLFKGII